MNTFRRLRTVLTPKTYNLTLCPNIIENTFTGNISINCTKISDITENTVELNSVDLDIKNLLLNNHRQDVSHDKPNQRISFRPQNLQENDNVISIEFSGNLNTKGLEGFYRIKHDKSEAKAVTQFCAIDARRCFPCFDEPAFKAEFNTTLVVLETDSCKTCLSNTQVKSELKFQNEEGQEVTKYEFNTTPVMSTYLLAFVFGNYDYYESFTKSGVRVRCYTPVGQTELGKFATETGVKCLEFYENYFGIDYPVDKLDMVPIKEFACGAMENWGLIFYRDARVLYNKNESSFADKQIVCLIVAHEIAHQWFGNLVTMEWWTDIWLNEGFATFMQYLCGHSVCPELKLWDVYLTADLKSAFDLDKLDSSHAILIDIDNPDEIGQVFDAISYKKGAAIIRMMHAWIGAENFRVGMSNYLKCFSYSNSETVNLWEHLEKASGKPVVEVMGTWTRQKGFPVLTNKNGEITVNSKNWIVPVFLEEKSEDGFKVILSRFGDTISNPNCSMVNPQRLGFYRAIQSAENLDMSACDRLTLLSDAFYGVELGEISVNEYVAMVKQDYRKETSYLVLKELFEHINCLSTIFGKPFNDLLPEVELFEVEEEIRSTFACKLIKSNVKVFSDSANFENFEKLDSPLPKLYYGVYSGLFSTEQMISEYEKASNVMKQSVAHVICTGSGDHETILNWIKSDSVANNDKPYYLVELAGQNKFSRNLVWDYLKNGQNWLDETYGSGLFLLPRLYKGVIEQFSCLNEVRGFVDEQFSQDRLKGAKSGILQGLETVERYEAILMRNK